MSNHQINLIIMAHILNLAIEGWIITNIYSILIPNPIIFINLTTLFPNYIITNHHIISHLTLVVFNILIGYSGYSGYLDYFDYYGYFIIFILFIINSLHFLHFHYNFH